MRPLIALPSRFADEAATWRVPVSAIGVTYQDAIVRAGGQPVALAPIAGTIPDLTETLSRFDGLCLPGGPDVDPHLYGADEIHPAVYGVDARHDAFDLAIAKAAIELRMPILAICRGHQVLNVALGGTLIQHLGDERTSDHRFRYHSVELQPGCRAALAMGTERPVGHSVHHQAIDRVADGMVVTGRADDGTIEATEVRRRLGRERAVAPRGRRPRSGRATRALRRLRRRLLRAEHHGLSTPAWLRRRPGCR